MSGSRSTRRRRSRAGRLAPIIPTRRRCTPRSAWLDANPLYTSGTAIPSPDYDDFAAFPVNHDVGVVELDEPRPMATYGELAPLGTAEALAGTPKLRNTNLVETVGYGIQSVQPHPADIESRFKSTSRIVEITGNQATSGNLHTLNNPSKVGGVGGSCFGDSGGPVFVNNTNQVIAVVSYGPSQTCHGADYAWRVDTAAAYEFLNCLSRRITPPGPRKEIAAHRWCDERTVHLSGRSLIAEGRGTGHGLGRAQPSMASPAGSTANQSGRPTPLVSPGAASSWK